MTCNYTLAEKLKSRFYIRDEAMRYSATVSSRRRPNRRNAYVASGIREVSAKQRMVAGHKTNRSAIRTGSRSNIEKYSSAKTAPTEVKVAKKSINPLYVAALVVATVMMMALIMSFSQVYQTANEVADLERELETLKAEESDLALQLEEKNDLRMVETIATTKLGMVKEDSLQKKYVSLSEGEHIVIAESEEKAETTTGGVMLSSVLSSIGRFFDNFR